jgi:hypothetical protein
MSLLSLTLLAITFDEMEGTLGSQLLKLFGNDTTGILLLGLFFVLVFSLFMFKAGVGLEAGIIFGGFALYLVTVGLAGQGNLLPTSIFIGFLIVCGIIIYLAFFKKEFTGGG